MLTSCVKESRIRQLKAMHLLMVEVNNEDIYADWILLVPDEPSEDDFDFMAESDGLYEECCDLFTSLIADACNGYYGGVLI